MNGTLSSIQQQLMTFNPIPLWPLVINLVIGLLLALVIRWHFRRFGSTLTNREEFGLVFPMVVLTITLIISVVKSSLALALGLVGALSIVRFRTPIKEPEELAYLFLCIAVGLSLGANQTTAAIIAAFVILICMSLVKLMRTKKGETGLFLSVNWQSGSVQANWLSELGELLMSHTRSSDLRRFDDREQQVEALYYINITDTAKLDQLTSALRASFPGIAVSFLDQKNISGF